MESRRDELRYQREELLGDPGATWAQESQLLVAVQTFERADMALRLAEGGQLELAREVVQREPHVAQHRREDAADGRRRLGEFVRRPARAALALLLLVGRL